MKEIDPLTTEMIWDTMKLQLKESIKVEEITRKNIPRISKDRPMKEAVEMMEDMGTKYLLVADGGDVVGLLTKNEANMVLRCGGGPDTSVEEFMSISSVSGKNTLREVARIMGRNGVRNALVRDDKDAIIGLASLDDVLVIAPELIREFSTLDDLLGLALESSIDISIHMRKKVNELSMELAKTGSDAEPALRELRAIFEKKRPFPMSR